MKFFREAIVIFSLTYYSYAASCSLDTSELFNPNISEYIPHEVDGKPANVPSPVISSVNVHRGTVAAGMDCDDAGTISIALAVPKESPFKINELGFQFKIKRGVQPDAIFEPIYALKAYQGESESSGTVYLAWLDGHPKSQKPIDLIVSVRAISNDGRYSPEVEFSVKSEVGKPQGIFKRMSRWFGG